MTLEEFIRQGLREVSPWEQGPFTVVVRYVFRAAAFLLRGVTYGAVPYLLLSFAFAPVMVLHGEAAFAGWLFFLIGHPIWSVVGFGAILQTIKYFTFPSVEQRIRREYRGRRDVFTQEQIAAAAIALREWKTRPYKAAVEKYSKPVVDLLLLAYGVGIMNGKVKRMVSIRAIEQDRAADAGDDEAEPEVVG